ncbi:MAG: DUF1648 domain-containing protein [Nibricoccus sp.]
MKVKNKPAFIFGILYVVFFGCLAISASNLPARVASHFDAAGRANGWMDNSSYLLFIAILGGVFPLVVPAICYCTRFLPDEMHNIPNRAHWLAPERRDATHAYLFRHSLWLASASLCFVTAVHLAVVQANRPGTAHLQPTVIVPVLVGFVTAVIIWIIGLFRHFKRVE